MEVTLEGMEMDLSDLHPENATFPMEVTPSMTSNDDPWYPGGTHSSVLRSPVYRQPPTEAYEALPSSTEILRRESHPVNTEYPMEVMPEGMAMVWMDLQPSNAH